MRARRSSSSARERSVPWRRSTKGETTARRTSTRPRLLKGLLKLSARRRGCKLRRDSKGGQAKQDAQEQPQIGVRYKILVGLHPGIGNGNQQNSRVPKNHEANGKPGRAPESLHDAPRREDDRKGHHQPKEEAADAHFHHERSESALDADDRRLGMEESCDVLRAKRRGADTVAIRPAFVTERAQEISDRVIPGAILQLAGAAAGRQRLRVKGHTGKEGLRKEEEQKGDADHDTGKGALKRAQDPYHFALAPGSTPDKGE